MAGSPSDANSGADQDGIGQSSLFTTGSRPPRSLPNRSITSPPVSAGHRDPSPGT